MVVVKFGPILGSITGIGREGDESASGGQRKEGGGAVAEGVEQVYLEDAGGGASRTRGGRRGAAKGGR